MFRARQPRGNHSFAQLPPNSATLIVAEIAKRLDATGIGAGQFATPANQQIIRVGKAALDAGQTKYTEPEGLLVVRGGVAFALNNEFGTQYGPRNIGLRSGGKSVISNLADTFLTTNPNPANNQYDGNNRMMAPSHLWVSHPHILANAGELHRIYGDNAANGYKLGAELLRAAIERVDPKIYMNTRPGNPSGTTDTAEEAAAEAEILAEFPGMVAASEIMYRHIIFGGQNFHHPLHSRPDLDNMVLVDCTAKQGNSNQPGRRGGIMAGPEDILSVANKINAHKGGNPPIDAQWGTLAAFLGEELALKALEFQLEGKPEKFLKYLKSECGYATDRWRAMTKLNESITPGIEQSIDMAVQRWQEAGLGVSKPGGAFYLYPDISSGTKNAIGLRVPENLPLYKGADPSVLDAINADFETNYKPMGGQIIKNSSDYAVYMLIHHGVGLTDGKAFFKPEAGQVSTTFRASAAAPIEVMEPAIERVAHGHEILEPAPALAA